MLPHDPNRPSTWMRFQKKLCDDCWGGCCTLPVEMGPQDLIRLGLAEEEELALSMAKVAKRLKKEGVIQSFHGRTQLFVLAQKYGRDCIYLDANRRCQVYDRRPTVCRQFPTQLGPRPGFCPHNAKGRVPRGLRTWEH